MAKRVAIYCLTYWCRYYSVRSDHNVDFGYVADRQVAAVGQMLTLNEVITDRHQGGSILLIEVIAYVEEWTHRALASACQDCSR
ncbi:unnamed protein product [Haemonchus placei]|uniref:Transposase n=1 Tax=Haemonchus placei TaxID=6290 RepID=A0A0N4X2D4_HAEPC|nr:unnamed protein product [Haemonchus placei]